MSNALVNEETGIRGYALTRRPDFATPYTEGRSEEEAAAAEVALFLPTNDSNARRDLAEVRRLAARWRQECAEPTVAAVRAGRPLDIPAERGKALFDQVRLALDRQQAHLERETVLGRAELAQAAASLRSVFVVIAAGLLVLLLLIAIVVRQIVIGPISSLGREVRLVAGGAFRRPVKAGGPREIVTLGADVDSMRQPIVAELSALQEVHERPTSTGSSRWSARSTTSSSRW